MSILGLVCPINIVMRTSYQDAQSLGLGVTEFEPLGKANEEINKLWNWILKKMEKFCNEKEEKNIA